MHVVSLNDQRSESEFEMKVDQLGDLIQILYDKGSEESVITYVDD